AFVLVFSAFGYQALAPAFEFFAGGASFPAAVMRGLVLLAAVFLIIGAPRRDGVMRPFVPMLLFFVVLTARLVENYFLRDLQLYIGADRMFLLWFGQTLVPALSLIPYAHKLDGKKVFVLLLVLAIFF